MLWELQEQVIKHNNIMVLTLKDKPKGIKMIKNLLPLNRHKRL